MISQTWAQDSIASIYLIQKVDADKIVLRWAPSTAGAWHSTMQYGYKIERIANKANSTERNSFTTIAAQVLPWAKDKWQKEKLAEYDDYCIIAAEMMYGKKSKSATEGKLLQRADDFQNRYTYSMMAADFSAQAADALGVRYVDTDIKPNYTYIYKVTSLTPKEIYPIEDGMSIAYTTSIDQLISPSIDHIESGDHLVHIFWEKEQYEDVKYTAYYLERTEDGKTFERITKSPFISSNQFGPAFNKYFIYTDSINENYKTYGYRLMGISPFAEVSPASEIMYGMGRDLTPPPVPTNIESTQLSNHHMKISWSYGEVEAKELRGFLIGRSANVMDSFQNISPILLTPDSRSFIDENPSSLRPNFYIVTAIDTAGNYSISSSKYAHIIDSIAPASPIGLKGNIQLDGKVLLSWDKNNEEDIMGYAIHFSNQVDHEYAAVTNKPILTNSYLDTIMIRTLSEKIYYKVVAIDKNFNYSKYSKALELKLPDIVPPSSPLVHNYTKTDQGILVHWINSTSDDVISHLIYRKKESDDQWTLIREQADEGVTSYLDNNISPLSTYFYKVHAKDDADNISPESTIVKVISNDVKLDLNRLNLSIKLVDNKALLNWDMLPDAKYYSIYKTDNKGNYYLLKKTDASPYEDKLVVQDAKYALRVTSKNGIKSEFSEGTSLLNK